MKNVFIVNLKMQYQSPCNNSSYPPLTSFAQVFSGKWQMDDHGFQVVLTKTPVLVQTHKIRVPVF